MASPDDAVTLEVRGNMALITLNQPKKLNAMTGDLYLRLGHLLRDVAAMDAVLVTVLTGTGRFFSAGADVTSIGTAVPPGDPSHDPDPRRRYLRTFVANNLAVTRAFYTHPKLLVAALNGPAVGLSAALAAHADLVYAAPHAYLLTPFTALGLVAEGGASRVLERRLGVARAAELLYMSRKVGCEEMVRAGFVNKVFDVAPGDSEGFLGMVTKELGEALADHVNPGSILRMKRLLRREDVEALDRVNVDEVMAGWERFLGGAPQEEFRRLASGAKRHKL